jgi:hypothetical protein
MIDDAPAVRMNNPCVTCDTVATDGTSRRAFLQCTGRVFSLAVLGLGAGAAVLPVSVGATGAVAGSERRYPIPANDGVTIDRSNQIITVRFQNNLYAFNLACPHENTALKWLPKDNRFQCPKHAKRTH